MRILLLAFTLTSLTSFAQGWIKNYGGTNDDEGYAIQQTTDGGYIITGYSRSFNNGHEDLYLIKLDQYGDTVWTKTHGGNGQQRGHDVAQTADGGYIITGYTNDKLYLVRTTVTGDTLWTKRYGNYAQGNAVKQTTDGGFIVAGFTVNNTEGKMYLIKTDSSGDTTWTKMYGGTIQFRSASGYSVQQTTDGGYIVTGYNQPYNGSISTNSMYLVKTNNTGDTLWTKNYGTNANVQYGRAVTQTTDGGFAISGYVYLSGSFKAFLYKTNANGDTLWSKIYPGNGTSYGYGMAQTSDGGYIIGGTTNNVDGYTDVFMVKTDAFGDTLWTKMYGGASREEGFGIAQTADGGFVLTGSTKTQSFGQEWNVYAIKTSILGNLISVDELPKAPKPKKLVQRFDLLGRALTNPQPHQPYIELYDDGSTAKVIGQ